jgi:hypothetical protein
MKTRCRDIKVIVCIRCPSVGIGTAIVLCKILNDGEYGKHDALKLHTSEYSFSFGNFSVPCNKNEILLKS